MVIILMNALNVHVLAVSLPYLRENCQRGSGNMVSLNRDGSGKALNA